jgi:hypothetical protein
VANSTIIPTFPGGGADFSVYVAGGNTHVVIDVLGYFAAPVATALDCTSVPSATTPIPNNNGFTSVDAFCAAGRTATGGGYDGPSIPAPGFFVTSLPIVSGSTTGWRTWVNNQSGSSHNIQTYVNCCRVPGR